MRRLAALAFAAVLLTAAPAAAQSFTGITDAVAGRNFNAAASYSDAPGHLIIGLDSGLNPATWQVRDFQVNATAYNVPATSDAISFVVTAPAGYRVQSVTYVQRGTQDVSRTGRTFVATYVGGGGAAVKAADPINSSTVLDLSANPPASVAVTISTSLVAQAAGARVSGAEVFVTLIAQ